ncbi:glycosyltransferase [Actinomadura sp. DC4]|uniref:glycosyltransferase n=1 Tax=Actinomadura sp. DC4 TaxID=3055069 RepID=UPI0025B1D3FA|nr:glycosyltransferase [Actinomadura sp. DC4]MDN3359327.1 glycosyltransferase [Actinomadura sp. DC4]
MRIDLVSEHASPLATTGGGQSVHVAGLAAALARRGHEVTVHTRRDDVALPDSMPYARGVTVEHIRAGPARPVARDELLPYMPEFAAELARRWAAGPPDVVHAHFWMSGLAALGGAAGLDIPVVQTFHALGGAGREGGPPERLRLETQAGWDAAAIIATCGEEARELGAYGIPPESVHVVPGGVDAGRFRPGGPAAARGDRGRVITVGRLEGAGTLIEALCHVPEAELVVVGGPARADLGRDPEATRLRRLAAARGVGRRVVFTGRVRHEDLPALLRSADVAVFLPSHASSGLAAIEAMACGVPVVVSAAGGHLDTVMDGVTGLHVPPRVPPGTLAGRLRRLLADPRLGPSLGAAGAARVRERHTWDHVAAGTEAVYTRVADASPAVPARS